MTTNRESTQGGGMGIMSTTPPGALRLSRITLRDWRSWRGDHVIACDTVTRIAGPNGSGKSGVLDAVRWALTGVCRGTDAGGRGAAALVATGADTAVVTLDCVTAEGRPVTVTRSTGKVSTLRVESAAAVSGKAAEGALEALLGVGPVTTGVVLDAPLLLSADHATAKRVLLDALAVQVPVEDLPWPAGAPDRSGAMVGLDELDALYKWAYEARRDARARLSVLPEPGAEVVEHAGGDIPDPADLAAQVAALEAEHQQITRAQGVADAERAAAVRAHHAAVAQVEAATKQIRGYASYLGLTAGADLADFARAATERVERLHAQRAELGARQVGVADQVTAALAAKLTAEAKLQAAAESPSARAHDPSQGCVLAADIPCKTSRKAFEAYVQVQAKALAALRAEAQAAVDAYDALAAGQRGTATLLDEALQAIRVAERADEAVGAALARVQASKGAMLSGEAIAALEAPSEADGAAAALWARVQRGRELVAQATRMHAAMRQRDQLVARRAAAAAEADQTERVTAALGPSGRRVAALAAALEAWQADVNGALGGALRVSFSLDPWGTFVDGRSAALLSESERLRVGVALGAALARRLRLRLVVVDAFDLFDSRSRAAVSETLRRATDDGLQVIVCVTRDTMPPAGPSGMATVWLGPTATPA